MHYGLMLRQLRQSRRLTPEQLAYEVGCHVSVVEAAESNKRPVPGEYIIAYSNALKENFEVLVSLWLQQVAEKILPEGHPGLSFSQSPPDFENVANRQPNDGVWDSSNVPF